jgi:Kef-type K+ transport system membrane component KefB
MALVASLISIRVGFPVALVEIVVGALIGNIPEAGTHPLTISPRTPCQRGPHPE